MKIVNFGKSSELNGKIMENTNRYVDASGQSIFDLIDPNSAIGTNGVYAYYNISDIPESDGSSPSNQYVRILKMPEAMFIIRNISYAYFTTASDGKWSRTWYKFNVVSVQ